MSEIPVRRNGKVDLILRRFSGFQAIATWYNTFLSLQVTDAIEKFCATCKGQSITDRQKKNYS